MSAFGATLCLLVVIDFAVGKIKERKSSELQQAYSTINDNGNEIEQKNHIVIDKK